MITTALDDTLVVEAAAGTGKTTALVTRVVRLIETGRARITEIVAVTFSEKAAGELKLRLREALEKARVDREGRAQESERLDRAVLEFEEAHVSTIHGFCAELLRERPVEARVDPAFEVLTEGRSQAVFDEAFAEWIEAALQQPGEGVRRSLRRRNPPSWRNGSDEEDKPIPRLRRAASDLLQWRDHPTPWKRPDWDRTAMIDRVVDSVLQVADLTMAPIDTRDAIYKDTESLRRHAAELRRAVRQAPADHDGFEALLVLVASDRQLANPRKGSGAMYSKSVARQTLLDKRAALIEALRTFRVLADADLAACLQEELQDCLRGYDARKTRAGALDFLDLLLRARDLMRDCSEVRRDFQGRFRYVLVDEFQDTDPVQAELLLWLTADTTPAARVDSTHAETGMPAIRKGALFLVGDPKQSIYRFRRADIGAYQRVCDTLIARGARRVALRRSFRSVPNIQRFVNLAFRGQMHRDEEALQAGYVELVEDRDAIPGQPSVIALPVPRPYGRYRVANSSIEQSLPEATGEFVRWLVNESGWQVSAGHAVRPLRASDVCLLFRRFTSYLADMTRPYIEAFESRGVPHLLVGGKTFHAREEVDAVRTALCAVEWPEDELSVFATLHGPLFAIDDEMLLEYHALAGEPRGGPAFHPYHVLENPPPHLAPVAEALGALRELHAGRNYRPVADTIGRLIDLTRAQAGFMLWRSGEQVLANVLHISDLARQYEAEGGLSFRGFVETLCAAADRTEAPEAPILEEGSEGIRLMTVHKAKGLEFPVVVLADMTCALSRDEAQRALESSRGLCAVRLAGWAPLDLIERNDLEARRDRAEGVRLAYVAATRARDLLVVPVLGDGPYEKGWVQPLNHGLYPPSPDRRSSTPAVGVPAFRSKDTVLERPDGELPSSATVRPGEHLIADSEAAHAVSVVWWDPALIDGRGGAARGLRREDLITKQAAPADVAADRARFEAWQHDRRTTLQRGARPSLTVVTATEWAREAGASSDGMTAAGDSDLSAVAIVDAGAAQPHVSGRRYGVLVHALLASAPLDATAGQVRDVAAVHARVLGASAAEREAAAHAVVHTLAHPLMADARAALADGRSVRREAPITVLQASLAAAPAASGEPGIPAAPSLIDGQLDLAFETDEGWTVVDFKTGPELGEAEEIYRRQVALYAHALATITRRPVRGVILRV
ncbi:MAG: UvrD-helicase domain-containing protein [Acidobacteriota bacterium]